MKAIVQTAYGAPDEVLALRDVDEPVPGDDQVLVQVHAASMHPDIWHVVRGLPYVLRLFGAGVRTPKNPIPGTDLAGVVTAVGSAVTRFEPGDAVYGEVVRGHQWTNGGSFAEYAVVSEDVLAPKPDNVTFAQAAAVPTSGFIAMQALREGGGVQAGQAVLVNGAGGNVGTIAVQVAKAHGAEVTAVDCAEKLDLLRSLGADHTIDYASEDFTQNGQRYDIIIDVASTLRFGRCRHSLTPDGTYVLIGHDHFGEANGRWLGSLPKFFQLLAISPFVSQLPKLSTSMSPADPLEEMTELLRAGKVTPMIDRTFPLSEVVEALRYLQHGKPRGKVIITPQPDSG